MTNSLKQRTGSLPSADLQNGERGDRTRPVRKALLLSRDATSSTETIKALFPGKC